jgi:hypothetical protein
VNATAVEANRKSTVTADLIAKKRRDRVSTVKTQTFDMTLVSETTGALSDTPRAQIHSHPLRL